MLNRYNIAQFRVNFPKGPSTLCIKREIRCSTLLRCHQFVMFCPSVTKVLYITLVELPSLNPFYLLPPLLQIFTISQIKFATTPQRKGLSAVCWCRLGDQKQQHPNIFSIFSATKEKVRFEREQFCVLCLDKGVVSQATDNRFTLMKAWAALHSLLQRLLSVGKWISLPLLLWFCL